MKMGRCQERLFNSVLTSDLLSETIKKPKEILFHMLKLFYDVVKELVFWQGG